MRYPVILFFSFMAISLLGCKSNNNESSSSTTVVTEVSLINLDPGHFHAALVQKEMFPGIDSVVHVYAPGGPELDAHLALINQYNQRSENPTHWKEEIYTGEDYLQKMLAEKKGNVVVIAGNNRQKAEYIQKSIEAGLNVLGDKPMIINYSNFDLLKNTFAKAGEKNLLLYDIMTERSEITNILLQEFSQMPEVFGNLKKGTPNDPSIIIESVHYYNKLVSGKTLTRPEWFFDPAQQGDAIADVGTHLIDLAQWTCFPNQVIDYEKDINILSSRIWPTPLSLSQYGLVTGKTAFPAFLQQYVKSDSILQTHGNGEVLYTLKDVHVKIITRWDYKADEGGDTHYAILKGTKANLEIKQGKEEGFQPMLYINLLGNQKLNEYEPELQKAVEKLNETYPGITLEKTAKGWKVQIPQSFKIGHEAHFAQVMQRYLQYLKDKKLPDWEVPNMIAKYYIATQALQKATK